MRALASILALAVCGCVATTPAPEPEHRLAWAPETRTLPRDPFKETGYPTDPVVLRELSRHSNTPSLADHYPLPSRWQRVREGEVEIYVLGLRKSTRVRLYMDNGKMDQDAIDELSAAFGDRKKKRVKPLNPRLLAILYLIGQTYERPMILVSGYRAPGGRTKSTSRHASAAAADIRVPGVPPSDLAYLVRASFEDVGVGHYPTSKFVHVDVRDSSYYWRDSSGPGQRQREEAVELEPRPEPGTDWTVSSTTLPEALRPAAVDARAVRN
jgi:uncharacterized protein YcbK (DUF882 family)